MFRYIVARGDVRVEVTCPGKTATGYLRRALAQVDRRVHAEAIRALRAASPPSPAPAVSFAEVDWLPEEDWP